MKINICPECGRNLEKGFANAMYTGSIWTKDEAFDFTRQNSVQYVSKKNLQEKIRKKESQDQIPFVANPPAVRCLNCGFIAFLCK